MAIGAIGGAGGAVPPQIVRPVQRPEPGQFDNALGDSLKDVSKLEQKADAISTAFVSGQQVPVHEVMVATTESKLAVDALVAVRNRAVEAYQEIMRLQV